MCASTKAPLTDKMNRGAMAVNCHVFVQMPNKDFISAGKGEFGFISDLKIFFCVLKLVYFILQLDQTTKYNHFAKKNIRTK